MSRSALQQTPPLIRLALTALILALAAPGTRAGPPKPEASGRAPGVIIGAPVPITTPAASGAMGSSLAKAADGTTYLSWLEPVGGDMWALKFSRFDDSLQCWGEARLIAQGADWFLNWADFPILAVQQNRLTAVWFVNNPMATAPAGSPGGHEMSYHAVHSISSDGGATWSPPQPITRESNSVEFVALQPLADGRLLAAWLDGRARAAGNDRQTLYARVLGTPGPDVLVDGFVCDCCQLSFVPTPGGGALLAYRGRTSDEIRDMQLARFDGQTWSRSGPLNTDGWKIAGCPVNGPQLAVHGDLIGAIWFTSPDNQAQVLARVSANAGKSFGQVKRIDLGRPQGRVDGVMLADGTFALIWLEANTKAIGPAGGIYLRTISPQGRLSEPRMLAPSGASRMSGFPRLILSDDRQLLLTFTQETEPSRVITLKVNLNE